MKVKFYKGYDESYYQKVLNEDITKLLSPWAFVETAAIDFGVELHISQVIDYFEKLGYVDYIADLKLLKDGETETNSISASNPKSILVSAKQHEISLVVDKCTNEIIETETCQT